MKKEKIKIKETLIPNIDIFLPHILSKTNATPPTNDNKSPVKKHKVDVTANKLGKISILLGLTSKK
jgi:hypothetical protein